MNRKELIEFKKRELSFTVNRQKTIDFFLKLDFIDSVRPENFLGIAQSDALLQSNEFKDLSKAKVYSNWMNRKKFLHIVLNNEIPNSEAQCYFFTYEYDAGLVKLDVHRVNRYLKNFVEFDESLDFDLNVLTMDMKFLLTLSYCDPNVFGYTEKYEIELYGTRPGWVF